MTWEGESSETLLFCQRTNVLVEKGWSNCNCLILFCSVCIYMYSLLIYMLHTYILIYKSEFIELTECISHFFSIHKKWMKSYLVGTSLQKIQEQKPWDLVKELNCFIVTVLFNLQRVKPYHFGHVHSNAQGIC